MVIALIAAAAWIRRRRAALARSPQRVLSATSSPSSRTSQRKAQPMTQDRRPTL
jgi:hypothetical protein